MVVESGNPHIDQGRFIPWRYQIVSAGVVIKWTDPPYRDILEREFNRLEKRGLAVQLEVCYTNGRIEVLKSV